MSPFYVACIVEEEKARVLLGSLNKGELQVSEVRQIEAPHIHEKDSVQWNIPQLYHELMEALRTVASYEEPVQSISCSSVAGDYLLFNQDRALITPSIHHSDPEAQALRKKVASRLPWQMLYEETGMPDLGPNMFLQMGAEPSKRFKRVQHVLPIADGLNFLLGGEARMEASMAGASGLYNPLLKQWSTKVLEQLKIRSELLPPVVESSTVLGKLREDLCKETGLEDVCVTASCSHDLGAMLAGLPVDEQENWAFIHPGDSTLLGTQVPQPIINEISAQLNFANQVSSQGNVCFCKRSSGMHILNECQVFWEERDRSMDNELLSHLAGASTPFESLIDPADPRFLTAGDMPLKIQAFCKETNQPVPRKPGPIFRCVLESLALHYRKLLYELEHMTGSVIQRVFVPSARTNMLLNHFTANSLQLPVTVISSDPAALGNIVNQALALGHIPSAAVARDFLRHCCKTEQILPHAQVWEQAYDRFVSLTPGQMAAA